MPHIAGIAGDWLRSFIDKERRMDKDDLDKQQTLLDLYRRALGMLSDTPLGDAALAEAAKRVSFEDKVGDRLEEAIASTGATLQRNVRISRRKPAGQPASP